MTRIEPLQRTDWEAAMAVALDQVFRHITRMYQLEHTLDDVPDERYAVRFESLASIGYRAFAATLERTYASTLDCPELNGKRSVDEIIAGHQAEGHFNPERWW